MTITTEISITPDELDQPEIITKKLSQSIRKKPDLITGYKTIKRSIDARSKQVLFRIKAEVFLQEMPHQPTSLLPNYQDTDQQKKVIIVGLGPAGMFAALRLLENGITPIVLERGKDVKDRRKDLRLIQQFDTVNPDSNYCFGEGGAGAYSDGKLYTRSDKRGNLRKILEVLVGHGADEDTLVDAHPHIGSNKLPKVVENIRETILKKGGHIYFNSRVVDFMLEKGEIKGVKIQSGQEYFANAVILATGHSARDIYYLLHEKNILIESKPFALGVRIEHPQGLIDKIQYHCDVRHPNLPAASYSLAEQIHGKGVYSFCMCPGGIIIPAATESGEIVVNGMSMSRRDSKFANSGMVVSVEPEDIPEFQSSGVFSMLHFQQSIEKRCSELVGGTQKAPAQRVTDFVAKKVSSTLPETSYIPGLHSAQLSGILPTFITQRLQEALPIFGQKMKGYFSEESILVATESRTSSPIRIPRDKVTLEHPTCKKLYPCGEGAGYAGGIVSAAMDGERVAEAIILTCFHM